jgi:aspartate racemase
MINLLGVLGGMGPAATVDFMEKLVNLTPAGCDQEHVPTLVANLPHVPDRSNYIMFGQGPDPLPHLLRGIDLLNSAGVGLIAIPCNTAHHWFDQIQAHSAAPLLHIGRASVAALPAGTLRRVSLFATPGTLHSDFYRRELEQHGYTYATPSAESGQIHVNDCFRAVKAGDMNRATMALEMAIQEALQQGVDAIILGCTEIPLAARRLKQPSVIPLIDSSLALAGQAVRHALAKGWNQSTLGV